MRLIIPSMVFIFLSYINIIASDSLLINPLKENSNPIVSLKFNYGKFFNDNSGFEKLFKEANLKYHPGSLTDFISFSLYGQNLGFGGLCEGLELLLLYGNGSANNDTLSISYPSAYIGILVFFNYLIDITHEFKIYPFCKFGLGGGGLNVEVNNNIDDIKFKDIFTKITPKESISGTTGVVYTGIGGEYLILSNFSYKINSIHLGFDVGYLFSGNQNWYFIGYKIIDMPNYLYKGFFLTLSLTYKY